MSFVAWGEQCESSTMEKNIGLKQERGNVINEVLVEREKGNFSSLID